MLVAREGERADPAADRRRSRSVATSTSPGCPTRPSRSSGRCSTRTRSSGPRSATAVDEERIGPAGWLFLTRPDGWQAEVEASPEGLGGRAGGEGGPRRAGCPAPARRRRGGRHEGRGGGECRAARGPAGPRRAGGRAGRDRAAARGRRPPADRARRDAGEPGDDDRPPQGGRGGAGDAQRRAARRCATSCGWRRPSWPRPSGSFTGDVEPDGAGVGRRRPATKPSPRRSRRGARGRRRQGHGSGGARCRASSPRRAPCSVATGRHRPPPSPSTPRAGRS